MPGQPKVANAHFVTDRLLIGGDLDAWDGELAVRQLLELLDLGVTHVLDVRVEWSDEELVAQLAPQVSYLHLGIDDAGQRVPDSWFERVAGWGVAALADPSATVLAHCHMGINRGPSAGLAILLATGLDLQDALDAIRTARPFAFTDYAEDALRWHHRRNAAPPDVRRRDREVLARWRADDQLEVGEVIRLKRAEDAAAADAALEVERLTS
jgi:dual specificity phosphatase 3